ncbi:hypothetical protein BH23BAC2_BH23BAC2_19730 [soil metagenome]
MNTLHNKNELHFFIESASPETLQHFIDQLGNRNMLESDLKKDLFRILEEDNALNKKMQELMGDHLPLK